MSSLAQAPGTRLTGGASPPTGNFGQHQPRATEEQGEIVRVSTGWQSCQRAALALLLVGVVSLSAQAMQDLGPEEDISDLLSNEPPPSERIEDTFTRQWAILPEIGFGPETGPLIGAKFTHRNFLDSGGTFDIDGTYALNQQQAAGISFALPHVYDNHLILLGTAEYNYDPLRRFFGLGNNTVGPTPISTNASQDARGMVTVGWRLLDRLAINFSIGLRQVVITNGHRLNKCQNFMDFGTTIRPCPFTPQAFPDLVGIDGGVINPIGISLVWNSRDDLFRPTRGWRVMLKIVNSNHLLGSFDFTRYIADASYLRWFWNRRFVAGLRVNGEYVSGGKVPWWELPELGGHDTLRGFFPYRFFGQGRILINTELRAKLFDFDFFEIWHVNVDGVVFGDTGRVFLNQQDLKEESGVSGDVFGRVVDNFRFDYGGGVRFELSEALTARIDVGFSEEEIGLVYLSFGHTF